MRLRIQVDRRISTVVCLRLRNCSILIYCQEFKWFHMYGSDVNKVIDSVDHNDFRSGIMSLYDFVFVGLCFSFFF